MVMMTLAWVVPVTVPVMAPVVRLMLSPVGAPVMVKVQGPLGQVDAGV